MADEDEVEGRDQGGVLALIAIGGKAALAAQAEPPMRAVAERFVVWRRGWRSGIIDPAVG